MFAVTAGSGRKKFVAQPTVSVVIPTYNRADIVARAIRSALTQTLPVLEVIVVDDGSEDDTQEAVSAVRDERLIYLSHDANRGGSAARNTGIHKCRGDWIAFLDSDDEWRPTKLERQTGLLQTNPCLDAAYCAFERVGDGNSRTVRAPVGTDLKTLLLKRQYVITLSTLLVRREVVHAVGLFDESLPSYQDTDLFLRLVSSASFGYVDESLVVQNISRNDRVTHSPERRVEGYRHLIRKHADLLKTDREGYASYWYELGRLSQMTGDRTAARAAFFRSVLRDPTRVRVYARLLECAGAERLIRRIRALRGIWPLFRAND